MMREVGGLTDGEKEDRNEISIKAKRAVGHCTSPVRGLLCTAVCPTVCGLYVSVHECVRGDVKQKQSVTLRTENKTPE